MIQGKHITTVEIDINLANKARQHGITWANAMRAGIGILLAEKGVEEYNTNLNIKRQKDKIAAKLVAYAEKFGELKEE